ncbi:MAG: hypothetical protein M0R05_03755 [Bacilli bacterium]|nr:hypothetical protein [Bacilli bacterium]
MKKFGSFILIFIFIFVFFFQITFGFFDKTRISDNIFIPIGMWSRLTDPANPDNVQEYLDALETIIETNPNLDFADIEDYLNDLLFDEDESGKHLDELFTDYTLGEVIETVELIVEFSESFLIFDENDQPVFPNPNLVATINLDFTGPLLPGEHRLINKVLQTANLSDIDWWSPISLQITIEAPDGGDIADYMVEVLFDANPFADSQPFSYDYLLRDKTSWNENRAQCRIKLKDNILVPINYDVIFNTVVYRDKAGNFVPVDYRHLYPVPQFTGNWCRLPVGPNIYLGPPTGSSGTPIGSQQEILIKNNPKKRTGLILIGKANGTKVELKLDIPYRRPRTGNSVPIIPLIIVVSRGLELDLNGNPLPIQSDLMIEPVITLRVIEGSVWVGD